MFKKILQNRVFQNFSFLTVGSIISQILGLIALIKIARVVMPDDYGEYTFMLAQGQLLITLGDLGLRNIIIRNVSRDNNKSKRLLFTGLKLKILAIILLAGLYVVYNHIWGSLTHNQLILISLFILFNCSTNLFESIFWAYQKMFITSITNIFWSLIWLIVILTLPDELINVIVLFVLFSIITLLKAILLYILLVHYNLLKGESGLFLQSSFQLLKESWPYFSLTLMMIPIIYLSNNYLEINSTNIEVGYFNLANKLMSPINLVVAFALSALFPNLSILWKKDQKKFCDRISFGFKYVMLITLLLSFLFTLFAKEIVVILFSEKYLPAVKVSQLQIWYVFLMGVNSIIGTIWGAVNKEKLIFKSSVINAIITTPLLYYGSKYGALGISYGYVISFVIFEFYLWNVFKKSINVKIEEEKYLWWLSIILFVISYFILVDTSLLIRFLVSLSVILCISIFLYKKNDKVMLSHNNND